MPRVLVEVVPPSLAGTPATVAVVMTPEALAWAMTVFPYRSVVVVFPMARPVPSAVTVAMSSSPLLPAVSAEATSRPPVLVTEIGTSPPLSRTGYRDRVTCGPAVASVLLVVVVIGLVEPLVVVPPLVPVLLPPVPPVPPVVLAPPVVSPVLPAPPLPAAPLPTPPVLLPRPVVVPVVPVVPLVVLDVVVESA